MTLPASGVGFEGRAAGGRPGARWRLRPFIEGLIAPDDVA
jgi:hypothetical protein